MGAAAERRVVVTGIGVVSPIGIGIDEYWTSLLEGRSGVRRVSRFDPTSYPCQVAGEVDDDRVAELVHPRKLRNSSKAAQLGLAATELALVDAAWDASRISAARVGTFIGTALGGWYDGERQYGILLERGARRVNPFIVNGSPHNGTAGEVAARIAAQGPQITVASGCTASLVAISQAATMIAAGTIDAAIAGGVETPLSPLIFAGMGRTGELACGSNDAPEAACRPFDEGHGGIVVSEGACLLILEAEDCAGTRGRTAIARVSGSGHSCDALGLFDLDVAGEAGALAVRSALAAAQIRPQDVGFVSAHANGAPAFDRKEAAIIRRVFGEYAPSLPVSSIKGGLGHPFGAAGAFQSAAAIRSLQNQVLPPTVNLDRPDPECTLDHVVGGPRPAALDRALVTSYGYGGVNAALVFAKA